MYCQITIVCNFQRVKELHLLSQDNRLEQVFYSYVCVHSALGDLIQSHELTFHCMPTMPLVPT